MSRRLMISRVLAAAGALLVLVIGLSVPTSGLAAVPVPQATTTPATPSPSPSASGAEAEPDELHQVGDESFLFERTASRLIEMRSEVYLKGRREAAATAQTNDEPASP